MAQFRVEFVLDQVTGKYFAEMYHPERGDELLLRTEALYPSQEAAVLGVVQLFKNAILSFPKPGKPPRVKKAGAKKTRKAAKKNAAKKNAAKKKAAKNRPAKKAANKAQPRQTRKKRRRQLP